MRKRLFSSLLVLFLTVAALNGAVALSETPGVIDKITFALQDDLQCTATNVPELIGIADLGFTQQFKLYYQPDTTFSFNKDITLSGYSETTESEIITIPAGTELPISDYVSWMGSYSPEAGTIVADMELKSTLNAFFFAIADVQYYEKNVEEGNTFISIRDLETVPQENIDSAAVHYNKGYDLVQAGQYEDAIAEYNEAIKQNPRHADAYLSRGNVLEELGSREEALSDYTKVIELASHYAGGYWFRGNQFAHLGQHEEALSDFNTFLDMEPTFAPGYDHRAYVLNRTGQYDKALRDADKAIALDGQSSDTTYYYGTRGDALRGLGRYKEAMDSYNQAIALDDKQYEAYAGRASISAVSGIMQPRSMTWIVHLRYLMLANPNLRNISNYARASLPPSPIRRSLTVSPHSGRNPSRLHVLARLR